MVRRIGLPVVSLVAAALAAGLWWLVLTGHDRNSQREADSVIAATGGDPVAGYQIIVASGCAACHDIPGIPGPQGHVGPSLKSFKDQQMIAGRLANSPDNLALWIAHPRTVDADTAMPDTGLSRKQAHDVAAYLYAPRH